ncbi:MAG: hypothetical protein ACRDKT_02350 [Actinomycetota bacterium]
MVDTIGAVVNGEGRKRAWLSASLHVIGATTTAGLLGIGLGIVGSLLGAPWGPIGPAVVVVFAALYLFRETLNVPVPIPQSRRQVPDWWRSFYTAPTAAFMFGAGLGIGFLTFLSYGTFVVVAAAAVVSGDPVVGAVLCGPFGLARSAAVAVTAHRKIEVRPFTHRLEALAETPVGRVVNATSLAAVVLGGATRLL